MSTPIRALRPAVEPRPALTQAQFDELREDIANALKSVGRKHGIDSLTLEGHRIHREGFNFMVRITFPEFDLECAEWTLHAERYGLDPSWLHGIVRCQHPVRTPPREFEVMGLRLSHGPTRVRLRSLLNDRVYFVPLPDFLANTNLVRTCQAEPKTAPKTTPARAA